MHIHILGICGTFMGSLAILAKEMGHKVTGCDAGVYPPMSTQLEEQGIELHAGYDPEQLALNADLYVVGNAISRGNPLLEAILNKGLPYTSGPAMLAETVLPGKWVLGVAGTHGKTTTTSMLAWILEYAGMAPGFLIGGVPGNFPCSARLGDTPFFVIEADEYDSAFCDKRSKFIHYGARTLIVNNLEFDHADIFADLAAIQTQFHHLVRTVPENGQIIYPAGVEAIDEVLVQGCWSSRQAFCEGRSLGSGVPKVEGQAAEAIWNTLVPDGSQFSLTLGEQCVAVEWSQTGDHNVANGVAAMLAARHVGVDLKVSAEALGQFQGVKRRMECLGTFGGVSLYDDFAHHPTAIETTLAGLRSKVGGARIIALIEPRSNTMRMGVHRQRLLQSTRAADAVVWSDLSGMDWLKEVAEHAGGMHAFGTSVEQLVELVMKEVSGETHVVVMSNGGFSGIHQILLQTIRRLSGEST